MEFRRPIVPIGLPISTVVLFIVGLVLQPIIRGLPDDLLVRNTILNGIPFILIFVSIVMLFITLVWVLASVLNNNVPARTHAIIESITIGGIVVGVLGMFQPWWFAGYRIGFHVLLFFVIAFITWSHITPKGIQLQEDEPGPASVQDATSSAGR